MSNPLYEALKDIRSRADRYHTPDVDEFSGAVVEAFEELRDHGVDLDPNLIERWLTENGCPEPHLIKILNWCKGVIRGFKYHRERSRYWANDIFQQWKERANSQE